MCSEDADRRTSGKTKVGLCVGNKMAHLPPAIDPNAKIAFWESRGTDVHSTHGEGFQRPVTMLRRQLSIKDTLSARVSCKFQDIMSGHTLSTDDLSST